MIANHWYASWQHWWS